MENPPPNGFSPRLLRPRATKLGTRMQVHNPNTLAKFQGHPPIITPFTPPHV